MDTVKDKTLDQLLAPADGEPAKPEHRAWMNDQIKATLKKKERGEINYTPLDQVRRNMRVDAS